MAANTSPIFVLAPILGQVSISTSNTGRDGSGVMGTLVTGDTDGTRIHQLVIQATGVTTAGVIRFFVDRSGTIRLWFEVLVSAITPSGTVIAFRNDSFRADNLPLLTLPSGDILKVATNNAETFNVFALGGDYS